MMLGLVLLLLRWIPIDFVQDFISLDTDFKVVWGMVLLMLARILLIWGIF